MYRFYTTITVLFMVAILLSGMIAYRLLPVSALPQVDYPTIQVLTFYPGAGPDVMASSVTAPLERQFGQVPGLTQMTSTSSEGCSVITLRFALELDIDVEPRLEFGCEQLIGFDQHLRQVRGEFGDVKKLPPLELEADDDEEEGADGEAEPVSFRHRRRSR